VGDTTEGRTLAGYYGFNANISFKESKAIKNLSPHPTNLRFGLFSKLLVGSIGFYQWINEIY